MLLLPMHLPCGPVHARLQGKLTARDTLRRLTAEDPAEEDMEMTELVPLPQGASAITYIGLRSHANSQDSTSAPHPPNDHPHRAPVSTQDGSQSRHHPSTSILAHLERTQAVDATRDAILASRAEATTRSRIRPGRTEPSAPPKYSAQPSSSTARSAKATSRRLDPMSAA
jgi:hypothetical protein